MTDTCGLLLLLLTRCAVAAGAAALPAEECGLQGWNQGQAEPGGAGVAEPATYGFLYVPESAGMDRQDNKAGAGCYTEQRHAFCADCGEGRVRRSRTGPVRCVTCNADRGQQQCARQHDSSVYSRTRA